MQMKNSKFLGFSGFVRDESQFIKKMVASLVWIMQTAPDENGLIDGPGKALLPSGSTLFFQQHFRPVSFLNWLAGQCKSAHGWAGR
jgi:hypothetical protein